MSNMVHFIDNDLTTSQTLMLAMLALILCGAVVAFIISHIRERHWQAQQKHLRTMRRLYGKNDN